MTNTAGVVQNTASMVRNASNAVQNAVNVVCNTVTKYGIVPDHSGSIKGKLLSSLDIRPELI